MTEEEKPSPAPEQPASSSEEQVLREPIAQEDADAASADRRKAPRGPRHGLLEEREALLRETGGYRLRMEPRDLAKLRELSGSKGKTDRELGEEFFDVQAGRLVASLVEDVAPPVEVRVVVDPYSRQAFLAVGRTIRGIVSF